jgi:predicted  nucleic acid-binding Zn-ribbon protein
MDFSPDTLRKRFAKLTKESDALEAKLAPLRSELNDVVAGKGNITVLQASKREADLRPKIRKLQEELAPIEMERAAIARALGGKTAG